MERSQFTFYRSFWDAIQELPSKAKAEVICAICSYALDGEEPKLSGTSKAIFTLIKPTLDASARKAENGRRGGSNQEAKDKREDGKQTESKTEANSKQSEREIEKENEKENEIENEYEGENECSPHIEKPTRNAKRKHGVYGWVKLTDAEYVRLEAEMGEAELRRCIEYVDESAQGNGNKNRWKDWNLVIRKCHREGWGLNRQGKPKQVYSSYTGHEGPTEEEYQRMQKMLKDFGGEDGETEDLPFA